MQLLDLDRLGVKRGQELAAVVRSHDQPGPSGGRGLIVDQHLIVRCVGVEYRRDLGRDGAHPARCEATAATRRAVRRIAAGRRSAALALAAEGLTNREIAQRQFVTIKAVQWHLRNVYRKLDVGSRGELPAALGLGP